MRHLVRSIGVAILALSFVVATSTTATAQRGGGAELSTSDRIAMLYAPQLNFTRDGDPLIRVGLLEGRDEVEFTPSEPIRLMPQGPGGPTIELPGDVTYTVRKLEGDAGEYNHWVTVDRLSMDQRDRVDDVVAEWKERGYEPKTFDVGGHFAVRGQVFDSRAIVVGVGGVDEQSRARELRSRLRAEYGIVGELHSERLSYPSARFEFEGEGQGFRVRHDDVLWVSARSGRQNDIRYTIPGIPRSYGQGDETRHYTGELIFAPDQEGQIAVVNNLGAERILKGTVPAETYSTAPQGALRAQAVAARNEIFAGIGVRNLADPFMLRSDVYDQVYAGIGVEQASASQAVDATRGQVMLEAGNRIVHALYSSNAGGFTENNENVWDAEPQDHLRGQLDAPADKIPAEFKDGIDEENLDDFLASDFDAHSRTAPVSSSELFRWEATVDADAPRRWLAERGDDIGAIRDAEVLERGISGRIIRFRLEGTQGETVVERELNIRRLFDGLRSGLFAMDFSRNSNGTISEFEFRGAGFGHGVGMCQTGAVGMADQGHDFRAILNHYYSGIDIQKLY